MKKLLIVLAIVFALCEEAKKEEVQDPNLELGFRMPSFNMPRFNMPRFNMPRFNMPKFNMPRFNVPKFNAPRFNVPKFNTPRFNVPKFNIPNINNRFNIRNNWLNNKFNLRNNLFNNNQFKLRNNLLNNQLNKNNNWLLNKNNWLKNKNNLLNNNNNWLKNNFLKNNKFNPINFNDKLKKFLTSDKTPKWIKSIGNAIGKVVNTLKRIGVWEPLVNMVKQFGLQKAEEFCNEHASEETCQTIIEAAGNLLNKNKQN